MYNIVIDEEFSGICPKLTAEEKELLEESIKSEGCREQLIVWVEYPHEQITCDLCHENTFLAREGFFWVCQKCGEQVRRVEYLLVDGHHRREICTRLDVEFEITIDELRLDTRAEVVNWIINNQLGRRNITPQQKMYLRGRRYNAEKQARGAPQGNENAKKQRANDLPFDSRTRTRLAEQYGVTRETIRTDAKFAEAVDTIEEHAETQQSGAGVEIKSQILEGHSDVPKTEVIALGQQIETAPTVNAIEISDMAIVTEAGEILFKREAIADVIAKTRKEPGPAADFYRLVRRVLDFKVKYSDVPELVDTLVGENVDFLGMAKCVELFDDLTAAYEVVIRRATDE